MRSHPTGMSSFVSDPHVKYSPCSDFRRARIAGFRGTMNCSFRPNIQAVGSSLLLFAMLHSNPALSQVACTVTYDCRGSSGCASVMGGQTTRRTFSQFTSEADCTSQVSRASAGSGVSTSCSCSGGGTSTPGSTISAPAAPGHEFDSTISRAVADGLTGRISPGNAVGFTVLGMLGNALFAPKTAPAAPQPDPEQERRALAAQQLNNSGIYLLKQRDYSGAINEFQQALAATPGDANIQRNLELAKRQQKNAAVAGQTSGALGQLLGTTPAITASSGTALDLVNLSPDVNVPDLQNSTKPPSDQEELKGQLDGVFSKESPASAPSEPQDSKREVKEAAEIDNLFQTAKPLSNGDPDHAVKVDAKENQIEDIFREPSRAKNPDEELKDSVADSPAGSNALPSKRSSSSGDPTQGTAGTGTAFFGKSGTPAAPDLDNSPSPKPVTVKSATDQLTSVSDSGATAKSGSLSNEATAAGAACGFDGAPCGKTQTIPINKGIAQTPAAVALAAHLPADLVKNDTTIKQDLAYFQKLDTQKLDTQARLDAVQRQIDNGTGDSSTLSLQKAQLTTNLNQFKDSQAQTVVQMKQYVDSIGIKWNEDPEPAPAAGATVTP